MARPGPLSGRNPEMPAPAERDPERPDRVERADRVNGHPNRVRGRMGAGGIAASGPLTSTSGGLPSMKDAATTHTGPLGSTIHVLKADPETVAALAAVDWNRHFRRVWLDPVLGIITLMAPSRLHEDLTELVGHVVDSAGSLLAGASKGIRSTRLRGRGEPPGTGMEPDGAFYIGERARGYFAACREGDPEADDYVLRVAPDLVVETEITSFDEGKIERYADLGVRELWRLYGRKGTDELRVDLLALRAGRPPRTLAASQVLDGLTPGDVCEAVEKVRFGETTRERMDAVSAIVRRRQRLSARVREEAASYSADPDRPETASAADA